MVAIVVATFFVGVPTVQAAAGPANVEYGYEPISGVDNGSSSGGQGTSEASDAGSSSLSPVGAGTSSPGFIGIITGSGVLVLSLILVALTAGWLAWKRFSRRSGNPGMIPRVLALLAVLVALPLVAFSSSQSASRSPAPKGFYGAITQTPFTATDSTRMARGGIESLRVPLEWSTVQPDNRDEFNWDSVDSKIGLAAQSGISVLPFLYASPEWATGKYTNLPVKNDVQRRDWKAFVRALVGRYGPGGAFWEEHGPGTSNPIKAIPIRTWQVWNEANFFYFATPVSTKDYVSLLKMTSKAIKAADPSAKIMLSGLYGSPPEKQVRVGRGIASYDFLRQVYARGGKPYFDLAAIHPYTPDTPAMKELLTRFRSVMAENGDAQLPLSITEVGWGSGKNGFLDVGSEGAQARQVKSAYRYLLENRHPLRLKSVYWFVWKDMPRSVESCNFCYTTGWFKAGDGLKAKPSWRQFVKFSGGRP
jgi:hypothetical protein